MPFLDRNARPLLSRVGGKQHATMDDHERHSPTKKTRRDQLTTQPTKNLFAPVNRPRKEQEDLRRTPEYESDSPQPTEKGRSAKKTRRDQIPIKMEAEIDVPLEETKAAAKETYDHSPESTDNEGDARAGREYGHAEAEIAKAPAKKSAAVNIHGPTRKPPTRRPPAKNTSARPKIRLSENARRDSKEAGKRHLAETGDCDSPPKKYKSNSEKPSKVPDQALDDFREMKSKKTTGNQSKYGRASNSTGFQKSKFTAKGKPMTKASAAQDDMAAKFKSISRLPSEPLLEHDDLKAKMRALRPPSPDPEEAPPSSEDLKAKFSGLMNAHIKQEYDDFDNAMDTSHESKNSEVTDKGTKTLRGREPLKARELDPNASGESSPLSDIDASTKETIGVDLSLDENAPLAICPFCKETVDPQVLLDFLGGRKTLKVRQQNEFHIVHQRQAAQKTYERLGYPEVKWGALQDRFSEHHGHLQSILENKTQSNFREELTEKVESGKDRTLLQASNSGALHGIMPGYYGTRGARLMDDYIIRTFGAKLRRLAANDKVIASRDTTGFVQAVLVPELATKLIMEDMDVDEKRARDIMKDSVALGDVVNEDIDDVLRMTQAANTQNFYSDEEDI